jgi:hypothetical protein
MSDLRVVEFLVRTPDWVKRYEGKDRALLRSALVNVDLGTIAERSDKGTYVELNAIGLRREEERLSNAIQSLGNLPFVSPEGLAAEMNSWRAAGCPPSQAIYRVAIAGLWLHLGRVTSTATCGDWARQSLRREGVTA